jgi:hypothetical protein
MALVTGIGTNSWTAQTSIRIKLLDADSFKPLKHLQKGFLPSNTEIALTATTAKEGIAVFRLHGPIPERFTLDFAPDDLGLCSDGGFRTNDVLEKGVIGTDTCKKSGPQYSGKLTPGELVVFGNRVRLWQRILQEIP